VSRTPRAIRPAILSAFAALTVGFGGVVGGLLIPATATADPPSPPDCTAANLAGVASGVAAATSSYLFAHPDVNDFYTSLRGRPDEEVPDATRTFFDTNPQAHADLAGIRQPLTDFRNRCGITPPEHPLGQ
jgi:heme-binding protein